MRDAVITTMVRIRNKLTTTDVTIETKDCMQTEWITRPTDKAIIRVLASRLNISSLAHGNDPLY